MVARPARLFGNDAFKAERREIKSIDKGIDDANRIVFGDIVINRVRQKRRLSPIRSLDDRPIRSSTLARGNRTSVR